MFETFAKYVAKCAGIDADKIDVFEVDLDRVYFRSGADEYIIRMWNITNEEVREYTLYRMVADERGSHGEEVYYGEHYRI